MSRNKNTTSILLRGVADPIYPLVLNDATTQYKLRTYCLWMGTSTNTVGVSNAG